MRFKSLIAGLLLIGAAASAQTITYKGETVQLGPHAFYIDGSLTEAPSSPYIFRTFNEAVEKLTDGTEDDPMCLYIAPWVYWVDDPDDPEIRGIKGAPIGIYVKCQNLHMYGMTGNAMDVVLCGARGQTQGSNGNFIVFDFTGDGFECYDLTLGNFCNVDLVFPYKPELGRPKRNSAITQAHVANCRGDRVIAENVRFISRLNMSPLGGTRRALFKDCHFESTDDALNGNAVYVNCDFEFWGQLPFGGANQYGTALLNCDFNVMHAENAQCFSKMVGRFAIIDSRYHTTHGRPVYAGWTQRPTEWLRCYQYNVKMDGLPYVIGAAQPYNVVPMDEKPILGAYRLVDEDGSVLYNTYNLLRGTDDWDPQGIKDKVAALSLRDGVDYGSIATCLTLDRTVGDIQTGGEALKVTSTLMRHLGYPLDNEKVFWKVQPGFEKYVTLSATEGKAITIAANNHDDLTRHFVVIAYTADGLECAIDLTVRPDFLDAPAFTKAPAVKLYADHAAVEYDLDLQGRADESLITWYRCTNSKGDNAIPVAVGSAEYPYRPGDAGCYLSASVSPKHLRCNPGPAVTAVSKSAVKKSQVKATKTYETDFSDIHTANQLLVKPGFWTLDGYKPEDTNQYEWTVNLDRPYWSYEEGINGNVGLGMLTLQQGARMRYTPLDGKYGDMSVEWLIDPAKLAGQGFASARAQYLDLFIKFDTRTLTGYALRIIRTTKYADAVDFLLVKYTNGHIDAISEPVSSYCFHTGTAIRMEIKGDTFTAHAESPWRPADPIKDPNLHEKVDLKAKITPNTYGGFGAQHTSTCAGESRMMFHHVKVQW